MDLVVILIYIVGIVIAIALIYFIPKKLLSLFGMEIGEEGCFIATATYGTPAAEEIDVLRGFRDDILNQNATGKNLVNIYYKISPPLADFIARRPPLRVVVRRAIIEPVIGFIKGQEKYDKRAQEVKKSSDPRLSLCR